MMELEKFDFEDYLPTAEEMEIGELLAKNDGNISAAARVYKKSRRTLYHRINDSLYLQSILEESRETLLDECERQLHEAVRRGDAWAVCFTLKTLGKKRGYSEKTEVEHSGKVMTVADLVMQVAKEEEERKRLHGDSWAENLE